MAEIKDLQKLIEEKAEKRLDEDISKLSNLVRGNKLIEGVGVPGIFLQIPDPPKEGRMVHISIRDMFYYSHTYMTRLKEFWLPKYIQEESELFMKKVDEIREDVDNLLNQ